MARYYQLATFLQRAPNDLIQDYLGWKDIPNDLVWKDRKAKDTDDIYKLLMSLDGERRAKIKRDFESIFELACPSAMKAVYQACNVRKKKPIIAKLDEMTGYYRIAMWLFRKHGKLFDLATKFDIVRKDSWKYCGVGTNENFKYDGGKKENFKGSIKDFYKLQGDARYCKVKHYEEGGSHYYFAYPEGKAEIIEQYGNSEEEIIDLTIKQLHEVVFVYNSETGILKTNAKGTIKEIASLQEKFCKHILDIASLPKKDNVKFNLEVLKAPGFEFPLDDNEIKVEGVKLREVRFVVEAGTRNRVLLTLDNKNDNQSYSDVLSSASMGQNQKLLKAKIDFARIQFVMKKPEKGKRKNLIFRITAPSNCTLEDGEADIIARKYLQEWGVMELLEFGKDNPELKKAEETGEASE